MPLEFPVHSHPHSVPGSRVVGVMVIIHLINGLNILTDAEDYLTLNK